MPTRPTVTTTVLRGPSAAMLVAAAENATLLVVGAPGHGDFVGLLLGAVSCACVTHAPCSVVVVPEPGTQSGRDDVAPTPV